MAEEIQFLRDGDGEGRKPQILENKYTYFARGAFESIWVNFDITQFPPTPKD